MLLYCYGVHMMQCDLLHHERGNTFYRANVREWCYSVTPFKTTSIKKCYLLKNSKCYIFIIFNINILVYQLPIQYYMSVTYSGLLKGMPVTILERITNGIFLCEMERSKAASNTPSTSLVLSTQLTLLLNISHAQATAR